MEVLLRTATEYDLPLILSWRSNPDIYQGFYSQDSPLVWESHVQWFRDRPSTWRSFIILYQDRPVGGLNISQLEHWSPEIGYYIGEVSLWGKGLGKQAVSLALQWLRERNYRYCHTTVLKNNERSVRLLKSLGFTVLGDARVGEIWMQKEL